MILSLSKWLASWGWHVPAALGYTSTRMGLAAVTALVLSIGLGKRFIRFLQGRDLRQQIRPEDFGKISELHGAKRETPTMGGLLILFTLLLSTLLWARLSHPFTWVLVGSTLFLGALGFLDDWLKKRHSSSVGLSGRKKLLAQTACALAVVSFLLFFAANVEVRIPSQGSMQGVAWHDFASFLYIPFMKKPLLFSAGVGFLFAVVLTVAVICGSSNAVNLTDGLDGLAAGCLILVATSLAAFAFVFQNVEIARYLHMPYISGASEVGVYLAALSGASLGFLWYNGHPAEVFMGDTGSLALGGGIGVAAVLLKREILLALLGGVFVAEAISVILQVLSYRYRNKKRIFLCAPLHHHFEYQGWHESKVVLRFWTIGLLLAAVALLSMKLQ